MILYDQESNIDWFYLGLMAKEEMESDDRFATLFSTPCVLYETGDGRVYGFDELAELAKRYAVQSARRDPSDVFGDIVKMDNGTYAYPGVTEAIDKAKQAADTANTALATAEQASAGANPQIVNLAKMQVAAMTFNSETEIASVSTLLPEWAEGKEYKQGDPVSYDGKTWRVSQDHTSQGIYPPGTSESLYYEIVIADDGVIVYRQAHGQYDSVRLGELRHYPGADDPVYRSKVDYNAYSPDTVPDNWEMVE